MRAFIIVLWTALVASFLLYLPLFTLGMNYIVIGHGLMPELCFAIAAVLAVVQLFLSGVIDRLEQPEQDEHLAFYEEATALRHARMAEYNNQ